MSAEIQRFATLVCPSCGFAAREEMPVNACRFFHECRGCGTRLSPLPGDCCVFCSYGDIPCPPVQRAAFGEDVAEAP